VLVVSEQTRDVHGNSLCVSVCEQTGDIYVHCALVVSEQTRDVHVNSLCVSCV